MNPFGLLETIVTPIPFEFGALLPKVLGIPSPCFAGILLFRKPAKTREPVFDKNDG